MSELPWANSGGSIGMTKSEGVDIPFPIFVLKLCLKCMIGTVSLHEYMEKNYCVCVVGAG